MENQPVNPLYKLSSEAIRQIETSPARHFVRAYNPSAILQGVDPAPGPDDEKIPVVITQHSVE